MIDEVRGSTCRIVCTPWRSQKRHWTLQAVVRVARYAVRDGENACELAKAVATELGCECDKCPVEVLNLNQAILEAQQAKSIMDSALQALRDDLGMKGRDSEDGDAWYRVLALRFRRLLGWLFILADIARIIDAAEELSESIGKMATSAQSLVECVSNRGDENGES